MAMSRTVSALLGRSPIDSYLEQCQVRNALVESENTTHVPPNSTETRGLLDYLRGLGIDAVIVGSVGVLHYVKDQKNYRPTVDLDLFVKLGEKEMAKIQPPAGWTRDRESQGVISWISPSGGYVDFLTAGKAFTDGAVNPVEVEVDPSSKEYPVAKAVELFRMKLKTMREKDLSDLIGLARAIGHVPTDEELGDLTQTQEENLELVRQWYRLRPMGRYGE